MSESGQRRHGLETFLRSAQQRVATAAGVQVQVLKNLTHLNLRGDANDAEFKTRVARALGQQLPIEANTVSRSAHRVYWLGPDEWLIVSGAVGAALLVGELAQDLNELHASVNDISGGQVTLSLAGARAAEVLSKACTLDFHPGEFQSGCCAQSGIAKTNVLIGRNDPATSFELIVRRSYAEYLALWLQRSAHDCGIEFH